MSRVMTYLSKDEYARFREVCEREECTPYMLIKTAVLDHIWAYPREKPPVSEKEALKPALETDIAPEPETPKIDAEELSESVRRILEGKEK